MGTPQVHVATSGHEHWVVDSGATHHVTPDSTNVMQGAGYNGPGGSNRSSIIPILKPTRSSSTPRQAPISVQPQELGNDSSSRRVIDSNAIGSTGQQRQNMVILPDMAIDESGGGSVTRPAPTP
ncbi:hypothetical protein V6N12_006460 [Hibiscus sabdariffa]|uniref:Uncharacterized protein n=1 Tax=Hibiscus sabdariffa TaxID=183260 RepID=A0ABR2EYX9_9ROSI